MIDQNVLGLEIAVDQVEEVEVLEREHDLRGVKARVGLPTSSSAHASRHRVCG